MNLSEKIFKEIDSKIIEELQANEFCGNVQGEQWKLFSKKKSGEITFNFENEKILVTLFKPLKMGISYNEDFFLTCFTKEFKVSTIGDSLFIQKEYSNYRLIIEDFEFYKDFIVK